MDSLYPVRCSIVYWRAQPWPFDNTKRSLPGHFGASGQYFITCRASNGVQCQCSVLLERRTTVWKTPATRRHANFGRAKGDGLLMRYDDMEVRAWDANLRRSKSRRGYKRRRLLLVAELICR